MPVGGLPADTEEGNAEVTLLSTFYSQLTTHYSQLTTCYSLLTVAYSLLTSATAHLLLTTYYLLLGDPRGRAQGGRAWAWAVRAW